VRERLRADEVRKEAEGLARRAERLVSVRPSKLVSVASGIRAPDYEAQAVQQVRHRGLTEITQRLKHPLARAIIYYEIVGLPLALRSPERTTADHG